VPAHTAVHLPDELSFEAGAAIACGTGTSFGALQRLHVTGGDVIAIFGQGPVGLAGTQLASAMGARVIALDISDDRLVLAKDAGAEHTINVSATDAVEAIKEYTHGEGADLALEASGAAVARAAAIGCLKIWGTCAFVGVGGPPEVNIGSMMTRQVTLIGSWTFSTVGQLQCAEFAIKNKVAVDQIFTDRWTLDQAAEAYAKVDAQSTGKGVILL
jgi:threonine dehydrogenase-like Zn-dependent dehydrogenase